MTIVDRYLLLQFTRIFLVCFISFSGLYVVIHIFTNLDEVVEISGSMGGFHNLALNFYGPRVLDFFNRMAGVLILVAAVFSVALMQRRRETTATEAAGITKARLVRPVIAAAILIIIAAAVCRELYIPQYKSTLVRSLTNWTSQGIVTMHHQKDFATGMLIQGDQLVVDEGRITDVQLKLPPYLSPDFLEIKAEFGIITGKRATIPAGLLLQNVVDFPRFTDSEDIRWDERTVIYTPGHNRWLKQTELFVVCNLDVQDMAYGENLSRYSSLPEMIASLKKPSQRFGLGNQVAIHERILKPILEFTLVLIGLPLVVCNPDRNIFVAAASCTAIILAVESTAVVSHAMGGLRLIHPTALAAWLPVLIFLPCTAFSVKRLFD